MNAKSIIRIPAMLGLLVVAAIHTTGQLAGPAKEGQPVASPYVAEELSGVTSSLSGHESELRAALADQPNSAPLLYALALVLRQEGRSRESLDVYTRAASFQRPTAQELRSVALDYVLLNDYDDAIHWLERAVEMDPGDTELLYSLGRCYYSKDRFQDAGKLFEEVLAIQPHDLKAEENLGLVYDATNDTQKAEEALRKAASWADANGKDEWPFLDLGGFLLDHGRAAEALDPLRTALHIRPNCADCHEKLGRALLAEHDSSGGIGELSEAARLEPANPRTHYELGHALRQAGQGEKAQQELNIAQKLYSTHSQE